MGFFVGPGVEGREKCRQKFANLQSAYVKYMNTKKQTGQGKINKPKYFDEVHDILGDKHKVEPVLIIDSLAAKASNEIQSPSGEGTSKSIIDDTSVNSPQAEKEERENRFNNVSKTVKRSKKPPIEQLLEIQKQNQQTRKEQFQEMITLFKQQNDQRHQQIMAIIGKIGKKPKKSQKRRRSGSSNSSDSD